MTLAYLPHFLHVYLDYLPRGFGFDREPGYVCLRVFRFVIEVERTTYAQKASQGLTERL